MSLPLIGAFIGLAFGVVEYVMFGTLIARADRRGERGAGPRALDIARKAQLVLFPVIGFVIGTVLARESGA